MLFNSIEFALFLSTVFLLYWIPFKGKTKLQNIILLIASYFFYSLWNWKFLALIIISSITDYILGIKIHNSKTNKSKFLALSILINIGILFTFKYFNFFISNINSLFLTLGLQANLNTLKLILPVGISFYTFQTLSYSIDIYKGKIKPTKDPVAFFAFVSFFPQLVAGPIERASHLIPQFLNKRVLKYKTFSLGMRQILWGLFKKIVIADNAAIYANHIFNNYSDFSGSTLFMGAIFFSLQIYGDFSGYSDIAIGTAKLFGFDLMENFKYPYFSKNIKEFWNRWHISLTSWFRDYIYIPLGGNRKGKLRQALNIFIVFTISGLWHGANWTFIVWGTLHGALLTMSNSNLRKNIHIHKNIKLLLDTINTIFTFVIVSTLWVFFRSENLNNSVEYLCRMINKSLFIQPEVFPKYLVILTAIMFFMEAMNSNNSNTLDWDNSYYKKHKWLRWTVYLSVTLIIVAFGVFKKTEFIYFAF